MTVYAEKHLTTTEEVGDGKLYTHYYPEPHGTTAANENIERGDISPDVAYAEIVASRVQKKGRTGREYFVVRSFLTDLWIGVGRTDTLREFRKSRLQENGQHSFRITRRYEIDKSALTAGTDGWTFSGIASKGDAYGIGTWTIEPKLMDITFDLTFSIRKAVITYVYTASRPK